MFTHLLIEYANPLNQIDSIVVPFKLLDNSVVPKWIERVLLAQKTYHIDAPDRFYGFADKEEQLALDLINASITIINKHTPIIERSIASVYDQDTLNYLHHIFEVYHGLLDQQNTEYWNNAPKEVQVALADLNLCVHRCEAVARGLSEKRHVVTWYGLPKNVTLDDSDYNLFATEWDAGTVFLNYVEIGKPLEDFFADNDQYIAKEAFQPFVHYSADFVVKFTQSKNTTDYSDKLHKYYELHKDYFGPWQPSFVPGRIPLAKLESELDLTQIQSRQYVKSVSFK
jgi:hypothetical protein